MEFSKKVAIVGAGPAGIAAAIQLKRCGVDFTLFEADLVGGLLHNANLIENYAGFPGGLKGSDFCRKLSAHLNNLEIDVTKQKIESIKYNNGFLINDDESLVFEYCLIASGTKPIIPDIINNEHLSSGKVFFEIKHCKDIRNSSFVVAGGGDAAFDYALNLSIYNNNCKILCRSASPKALPLLIERVKENHLIDVFYNETIMGVTVDNEKVTARTNSNEFFADYLMIATGRESNLDFLKIENTEELIQKGRMLFAGDVKNGIYRQVAISSGDGLKAAMKIFRDLNNLI